MPPCSGQWTVKPGLTAVNVALSVVDAVITHVPYIGTIVPWVADNPIIGSSLAESMCNSNPSDPGDFSPSMLWPPPTLGDYPLPSAPAGSLMRWLWDKTVYWEFFQTCICTTTQAPPPTPITITQNVSVDQSVNQTQNNTQLTNIEVHQELGTDSLREIYNGIQHVSSLTGEVWLGAVPNVMDDFFTLASNLTGEGAITLPVSSQGIANAFSTYVRFIHARVDQIGPKVGVRGTRNPRLYGVGSLMLEYLPRSGQGLNTFGRHSIHYYDDVFRIPPDQMPVQIAYRIMDGCVISLFGTGFSTDNVMNAPTAYDGYGWLPFANITPPPSWSDPPIYGGSATRQPIVPGGSAAYRIAPTLSPSASPAQSPPPEAVERSRDCPCQREALAEQSPAA